jgi:UDP-N-acetylmuramate--alanine ligase
MVAEADESDRSFLKLFPTIAVVTNIDYEHLDNYGGFDDLQQAFVDFANKVPFYGTVVACVDDGPVRALVPRMTRRVVTYGLEGSGATVTGRGMTLDAFGSRCRVARAPAGDVAAPAAPGPLSPLVGPVHQNARRRGRRSRARAAVRTQQDRAEEFRGVESDSSTRRPNDILVIDDYSHHPTEIACLAAARLKRRLFVAFNRTDSPGPPRCWTRSVRFPPLPTTSS